MPGFGRKSEGTYSKHLQSYRNCSVTIENFQDTNNLACLMYSKDFKLLLVYCMRYTRIQSYNIVSYFSPLERVIETLLENFLLMFIHFF